MKRLSLLVVLAPLFCSGIARAGVTYQLMVSGNDSVSESDVTGTYTYSNSMSTQTQSSVSLSDSSPITPYDNATADLAAGATYGALHASALTTATTGNIYGQFGPSAQASASASAIASDTLYMTSTSSSLSVFQNSVGGVVVAWTVDGRIALDITYAGEQPTGSYTVAYGIYLNGNSGAPATASMLTC